VKGGEHCKTVPRPNALNIANHRFVVAADEQHPASVFRPGKLANQFDGIGLAERKIENHQCRRHRCDLSQHWLRTGEFPCFVANPGEHMEHGGPNPRIVVKDVCEFVHHGAPIRRAVTSTRKLA
jgi:hypothetical protein